MAHAKMKKKGASTAHMRFLNDFFDLKNYQDCEKWSLSNWINALHSRQKFLIFWQDKSDLNAAIQGLEDMVIKVTANTIKDPIPGVGTYPLPKTPLREITLEDLNTIAVISNLLGVKDDPRLCVSVLTTRASDLIGSGYQFLNDKVFAQFNLSATDEMLIERFKEFVKASREKYGIQPVKSARPLFDEKDFKIWRDQRVLPYIDLFVWNKARGSPLTNEKLAELLELGDLKTVRNKAVELLSKENIEAMNLQLSRYWH